MAGITNLRIYAEVITRKGTHVEDIFVPALGTSASDGHAFFQEDHQII